MLPLLIAHRGYSSRYPENSFQAYEEALRAGADGFECDLRISSDEELILFHDHNLLRLTGERGRVESSSFERLKKLRVLGSEPIPSLEEVLNEFDCPIINLEIKSSPHHKKLVNKLVKILEKSRPKSEIVISSFSIPILCDLSKAGASKYVRSLALVFDDIQMPSFGEALSLDFLSNWNVRLSGAQGFHESKDFKENYWVWTVNRPNDLNSLLRFKAAPKGIVTDRPLEIRQYLALPTRP